MKIYITPRETIDGLDASIEYKKSDEWETLAQEEDLLETPQQLRIGDKLYNKLTGEFNHGTHYGLYLNGPDGGLPRIVTFHAEDPIAAGDVEYH